jgi:hypothetical protein
LITDRIACTAPSATSSTKTVHIAFPPPSPWKATSGESSSSSAFISPPAAAAKKRRASSSPWRLDDGALAEQPGEPEERLLDEVVGVAGGPGHPVRDREHQRPELLMRCLRTLMRCLRARVTRHCRL